MGNPVIGIEVEARMEKLRAQLSTLGPGMEKEAKLMTAALAKEIKAQTKAMKDAAKVAAEEAKKMAGGFARVDGALDKVGSTTRKLGGFMRALPGPMGEATAALNDLGDVGEVASEAAQGLGISLPVAGAAVAALTLAVGAGYLAWRTYGEDEAQAKAITDAMVPATQALNVAMRQQRDALVDLRVVREGLSAGEAAALKSQYATVDATKDAMAGLSAEVAKNQAALDGWTTVLGDVVTAADDMYGGWNPIASLLDGVTTSSDEARENLTGLSKAQVDVAAQMKSAGEAYRATVIETDNITTSTKSAAAAMKELADKQKWLEDENKRIFDDRRARDKLHWDGIREGIEREEDAAEAAKKASAEKLAAMEKEAKAVADLQDAVRAYEVEKLELGQTSADAVAGLAQQALSQQLAAIDTSTTAGKEAAMKVWETQQAVALAVAGTQAALGIAVAAASAPPPLNLIPIAAASVTGAANIASVAITPPPKFHMGTNEVPALLQPKESVLTAAASDQLGRDNIARLNAGGSSQSSQSLPVTIMYDHRAYNRFMRDDFKLGGVVVTAINAGRKVGHRENR